jgi:hypothetical protein
MQSDPNIWKRELFKEDTEGLMRPPDLGWCSDFFLFCRYRTNKRGRSDDRPLLLHWGLRLEIDP